MATWEDGPEYAPLERPDAFAQPADAAAALEAAPLPPVASAAPVERPRFDDPAQAVPPLEELVPAPPAQRDPNEPFDVASSVMTAESSAWASAHWAAPRATTPGSASFPSAPFPSRSSPSAPPLPSLFAPAPTESASGDRYGAGPPPNGRQPAGPASSATPAGFPAPTGVPFFPPPTGSPAYPPPGGAPSYPPVGSAYPPVGPGSQPFAPPGYPAGRGPFPAPGTPEWFVPGAYQQPIPPPPTPTARTVLAAATPGVLIALGIGGLIWTLAPVTLVLAFLLSNRMTYGRRIARTVFAGVLAFLGLVGLIALVGADGLFAEWWDTVAAWAFFASWVLLVTTVIAAYRALKQGRPDPPPINRGPLR